MRSGLENKTGVLAVASAAAPTYQEGEFVFLSTDLHGALRTDTGGSGAATDVNLVSVAGSPIALGQTTMSASLPVVLASNQSAVPVSGTFWQATQPVSAASLPLPTGAATEATLSTLNGKVTACNTGAVVIASGT